MSKSMDSSKASPTRAASRSSFDAARRYLLKGWRLILIVWACCLLGPKAHAIIFYWQNASTNANAAASWFSVEGVPGPPSSTDVASFVFASISSQPQLTADLAVGAISLGSSVGEDLFFTSAAGGVKTLTIGDIGLFNSSGNTMSINGGTLNLLLGANTSFKSFTSNATIVIGSGLNAFDLGGNTLTLAGVGTVSTIAKGIAAGSGSIVKAESGTWTLGATNGYTGGTSINGGTLEVSAANALGPSGTITFGGGTLRFNGAASTTDYSSRFSTAPGQQFNFNTNGESVTFAAALSSAGGSLSKSGAGTLSLTANGNSASGGTTVSGGNLKLTGTANSIGAISVNSGGVLQLGVTNALVNTTALTLNGGMLQITGGAFSQDFGTTPLRLTASSVIDFGSGLGASAISFGASAGETWSGSLTISNYSTAGGDTLRFGTGSSGLTGSQLAQINFDGIAAQIDASGYVTPVPEPSIFAMALGLGALGFAGIRSRRGGRRAVG